MKGFLRRFKLKNIADASVPTPPAGEITVFASNDDNTVKAKKSSGAVVDLEAGGGGFPARDEVVHTTASLADLAEEDDQDATLFKSVAILKVEVDRACRVRLYADAASRTADLARDWEYPATDGIGVYLDFQFSAAGSIICSPQILASDMKTVPDGDMPVAIQNLSGSTSAVEVTFTVLQREE